MKRKTNTAAVIKVPIPSNFKRKIVLNYYGRDPNRTSECVEKNKLQKAFLIDGIPSCLSIDIKTRIALVSLRCDAIVNDNHLREQADMYARMILGLNQPIELFEKQAQQDRVLAKLIEASSGLRVPQASSAWEALISSIIGQQISVSAATSTRSRFISGIGAVHSSGLNCFPAANDIIGCGMAGLRDFGLSGAKASAILSLARATLNGKLDFEGWRKNPDFGLITNNLLAFKGVGPWTVNYTLLRGFSYLDGSLHGDVVVRKKLCLLLGREKMTAQEVEYWLLTYRPWRALVAAHLWAM